MWSLHKKFITKRLKTNPPVANIISWSFWNGDIQRALNSKTFQGSELVCKAGNVIFAIPDTETFFHLATNDSGAL